MTTTTARRRKWRRSMLASWAASAHVSNCDHELPVRNAARSLTVVAAAAISVVVVVARRARARIRLFLAFAAAATTISVANPRARANKRAAQNTCRRRRRRRTVRSPIAIAAASRIGEMNNQAARAAANKRKSGFSTPVALEPKTKTPSGGATVCARGGSSRRRLGKTRRRASREYWRPRVSRSSSTLGERARAV